VGKHHVSERLACGRSVWKVDASRGALQDAGNAGKAIGAGIIVLLWVVVDFFLGVGYGIYKLATRYAACLGRLWLAPAGGVDLFARSDRGCWRICTAAAGWDHDQCS
jgi:hypothetical protein